MAEILTNNLLSMLQTNVAETSKTTRENSFLDTGKESFENVLSGLNEKLAPAKNESAPDKKMKPELSGNDQNSQKQNIVSNKNKKFDLQKNVNNKSNDSNGLISVVSSFSFSVSFFSFSSISIRCCLYFGNLFV